MPRGSTNFCVTRNASTESLFLFKPLTPRAPVDQMAAGMVISPCPDCCGSHDSCCFWKPGRELQSQLSDSKFWEVERSRQWRVLIGSEIYVRTPVLAFPMQRLITQMPQRGREKLPTPAGRKLDFEIKNVCVCVCESF